MKFTCDLLRDFEIHVTHDLLESPVFHSALDQRKSLLVTTPTVDSLHGARLRQIVDSHRYDLVYTVQHINERTKTMESAMRIAALAKEHRIDRHGQLIAFGGGVCSDIVGLAACMIRRGLRYVRIPTTLIGQVDAGVGLKVGVNFGSSKNYLGQFYPPQTVIIDPRFLQTLPPAQIRHGLAEILKMALVREARLFEIVALYGEELTRERFARPAGPAMHIIERSIALMVEELGENPYETKSLKRLVDFGHTFSPEIEAASGYQIPHGDAVAMDMALSSALATLMGLLEPEILELILSTFETLDLPLIAKVVDEDLCVRALAAAELHRGGNINLVVPTSIGSACFIEDSKAIDASVIRAAVAQLRRRARPSRRRRPLLTPDHAAHAAGLSVVAAGNGGRRMLRGA